MYIFPTKAPPLQTPSEIKVENEAPLQVDLSSPGSPDSSSSMSDDSQDSKVEHTHKHTAGFSKSLLILFDFEVFVFFNGT